ncbi:hypothetical protein CALCODRAFT_503277 [Calocera cornea HHB12733]|uniref:Uncharacterized protein n=1 Tax=Calocera cornea HHB12733 TaxID=1353952 RepID=A0A165CY74_9BASI|nr:hypothetical protein CALCODRAFT_503277 [Calocera cornea HHB12733]
MSTSNPSASTSANRKADQIVHRFYLKTALLLAQARESHVHPADRGEEPGAAGGGGGGSGGYASERDGARRKADKWVSALLPLLRDPSAMC